MNPFLLATLVARPRRASSTDEAYQREFDSMKSEGGESGKQAQEGQTDPHAFV